MPRISTDSINLPSVVFVALANKVVANSTTESSLIGSGRGSLVVAANSLRVGSVIKMFLKGVVSTSGSPTSIFKTKVGSASADTASSSPGASLSNALFEIEAVATVRSIGASGTIVIESMSYIAGSAVGTIQGRAARLNTGTINTTIANNVDVTYTWGTADAGNTITCDQAVIEVYK